MSKVRGDQGGAAVPHRTRYNMNSPNKAHAPGEACRTSQGPQHALWFSLQNRKRGWRLQMHILLPVGLKVAQWKDKWPTQNIWSMWGLRQAFHEPWDEQPGPMGQGAQSQIASVCERVHSFDFLCGLGQSKGIDWGKESSPLRIKSKGPCGSTQIQSHWLSLNSPVFPCVTWE